MITITNDSMHVLPPRSERLIEDKATDLDLDTVVVVTGEFDQGYGTIFDVYDELDNFQFSINTVTNQIFYTEDELEDSLADNDDDFN